MNFRVVFPRGENWWCGFLAENGRLHGRSAVLDEQQRVGKTVGDDAVTLVMLAVLRRFFEFFAVRHCVSSKILLPVSRTGACDVPRSGRERPA